jgi:hypothetical protein
MSHFKQKSVILLQKHKLLQVHVQHNSNNNSVYIKIMARNTEMSALDLSFF